MRGTHHFNFDGRYLYLGTEYRGFIGMILVIVDLADPVHPREVSHWWVPGQETPEEDSVRDWVQHDWNEPVVRRPDGKYLKHVGMHYATPYGNVVYLAYRQAGLIILDVSDKSKPRQISRTDYVDPWSGTRCPGCERLSRICGWSTGRLRQRALGEAGTGASEPARHERRVLQMSLRSHAHLRRRRSRQAEAAVAFSGSGDGGLRSRPSRRRPWTPRASRGAGHRRTSATPGILIST